MLRLALLATAIVYANAATSGDAYTLFQLSDTDAGNGDGTADSHAICIEGGAYEPTGETAAHGPRFKTANSAGTGTGPLGVFQSAIFIEDECYNIATTGDVPMAFAAVGGTLAELGPAAETALSFKIKKGDGAGASTGAIADVPYIFGFQADDCETAISGTGTPMEPDVGTNGGDVGFQCGGTAGALSTGFKDMTDAGQSTNEMTKHGWNTITYVRIDNYNDADASAPAAETCATAETTTVGTEKFYMHIAADDNVAHGTAVTGDETDGAWKLRQDAACYVDSHGAGTWTGSSYQAICEKETGDVVWEKFNADAADCTGAGSATMRFNKNDYGTADISCVSVANTNHWGAATADIEAVCANPSSTATAKWFTGYLVGSSGTCATHTGATATENDGSRAVILGVCYTNAHADGEMTGWQGPFTDGAAGTEPIAVTKRTDIGTTGSGGSYKFTDVSGVITLTPYATPDCSGTAGTAHADDPAGGGANDWPCNGSSLLSHGAVGASGNGATQLQTASYYLTVRSHGDATTGGNPNMGGACYGQSVPASGERVDHFILDQCFQSAAATSYKWKCESSGPTFTNGTTNYYAISYDTYSDATCGTASGTNFKYFTQTSFSACALTADGTTCTAATSDTAAEWALNTLGCGACSDTSVDTEAACLALSTPGTWTAGDGVNATTTGRTTGANDTTCTSTHGSQTEWGGRCLQVGAAAGAGTTDNSWEILTDDATWAAMCGPATPAPASSTTASTSGAGKVAATAAAAAAAAAILL